MSTRGVDGMLSQKNDSLNESDKNFCSNCGTPYFPGDQYCATCGDSVMFPAPKSRKHAKTLIPEEYSGEIQFLIRPEEEVQEFFEMARWPLGIRKSFAIITDQRVHIYDQFVSKNWASFAIPEIKEMKMTKYNWLLIVLGISCFPFFAFGGIPVIVGLVLILKGLESALVINAEFYGAFTIHGNESRLRVFYAELQRRMAQEKR
ncbi:MAG: zinc ribbon domain-containing protein [Candidatus Heimdallarchaeota archaeon]